MEVDFGEWALYHPLSATEDKSFAQNLLSKNFTEGSQSFKAHILYTHFVDIVKNTQILMSTKQ